MKNFLWRTGAALAFFILWGGRLYARQYATGKATASFTVTAPAKKITASSDAVKVRLDTRAAIVQLDVAVSSFRFSNNFVSDTLNAVIAKRFNSYYLESNLYPQVTFRGKITNNSAIHYEKDGKYVLKTQGMLSLHGQQREVTAEGQLYRKNGKIILEATLTLKPADYYVRIPAYIGNMYFREVTITVQAILGDAEVILEQ